MSKLVDKQPSLAELSYAEFCQTNQQDTLKREFINGQTVTMQSPNAWHQAVVMEITLAFGAFLRDNPCRFWPGRDVHLQIGSQDFLYVPDGLVLCDATKDDGQTIHGAPDFVLEVWSPGNSSVERKQKIRNYQLAGVGEIWEITGSEDFATCVKYVRNEAGQYAIEICFFDEILYSSKFSGCTVDLKRLVRKF